MVRRLAGILVVWTAPICHAQDFGRAVLPVLTKRCVGCHNTQGKAAGLDLQQFRNSAEPGQAVEIWKKVRARVAAGTMPPPTASAPTTDERLTILRWVDSLPGIGNAPAVDPGRVTARRLNRVEYDNTVRDLLGVNLHTAAEFPTDDSGYGFDNIGDVLSLSPLLMEKLMMSARRISRAAIYGESYSPEPTLLVKLKPKRSQDDSPAGGDVLPYSLRGALYGSYHFPVDAEYEFRWRYSNLRGNESAPTGQGPRRRGVPGAGLTPEQRAAADELNRISAPPLEMVFTIDGATAMTATVEGNTDYNYARGETVARVPLAAGDHELRISFPQLANLADPRTQLNPDGRRKVFIDYLDILGPYQPAASAPTSYARIFVCGHAPGHHDAQCARRVIGALARRAYRRPVTGQDLDPLLTLVGVAERQGDPVEEGVRLALQAILVSPSFLFRIERDPARSAGVYALTDYELASRLSYFLWSSMPDEELMRVADRGELRRPEALERQTLRMLKDPRSVSLADNFAAQWLNLRVLERKKPDPARFPTVDDELLDAMKRETSLFVTAILREDRSILDSIDAPFTYLNGPLARHYGIAGVDGEAFARVQLNEHERGGLVGQASILTLSSYATRTSPVLRGKWILENLLGTPLPPPPAEVPPLDEANLGAAASVRQRLEQHRASPACGACHNQMDPLGFTLENYDAAGRWRTKDGSFDVDNTGTTQDGTTLAGVEGLKRMLRERHDLFTRNLAEKMLTFALGRGLEPSDEDAVAQICRATADGDYRFSRLVLGIVQSRLFRMRRGDGGTHEPK